VCCTLDLGTGAARGRHHHGHGREDLRRRDAEKSSSSKASHTPFPGTLAGLLDALAAARYRSAAGTAKVVVIVEGRRRTIIRRFEGGNEAWSASRAEIRHERGNGPPS
jgi:hypothetical protein